MSFFVPHIWRWDWLTKNGGQLGKRKSTKPWRLCHPKEKTFMTGSIWDYAWKKKKSRRRELGSMRTLLCFLVDCWHLRFQRYCSEQMRTALIRDSLFFHLSSLGLRFFGWFFRMCLASCRRRHRCWLEIPFPLHRSLLSSISLKIHTLSVLAATAGLKWDYDVPDYCGYQLSGTYRICYGNGHVRVLRWYLTVNNIQVGPLSSVAC